MEDKITYIANDKFTKMTKRQKLEMPMFSPSMEGIEISKLVISPTSRKTGGYFIGDFFAFTPEKGWWRPMGYYCWQIVTDVYNPANLKYQILKGDFENGGVQIFGFADEYHQAFISYGGQITIKKRTT